MKLLKNLNVNNTLYYIFCGLWMFSSKRKHLLMSLLSLEFIVLNLLVMMSTELYMTMFLYLLQLGLSILVSMSRTRGNDYFNSFGLLQC